MLLAQFICYLLQACLVSVDKGDLRAGFDEHPDTLETNSRCGSGNGSSHARKNFMLIAFYLHGTARAYTPKAIVYRFEQVRNVTTRQLTMP